MSKRFLDTELWQKEWFQDLSLRNKVLLKYIFENCDNAGVWNINFRMASYIIGEKVSIDNINEINNSKLQFDVIDNDKIFVIDFINFQYGNLSENCKPHKPIIEKLKKYGIFERVLKGYAKGIETLEEKEKEQYKEKEIEKEKERVDIFNNPTLSDFKKHYKSIFGNSCSLGRNQLEKLSELSEFVDMADAVPLVLKRLKQIKWEFKDGAKKPNVMWLLDGDNFLKVLNKEFGTLGIKAESEKTAEDLEKENVENGGLVYYEQFS